MSEALKQSEADLCETLLRQARLCDQWATEHLENARSDAGDREWNERAALAFQTQACQIRSRIEEGVPGAEILSFVLKFAAKLKAAEALKDRDVLFFPDERIEIVYGD